MTRVGKATTLVVRLSLGEPAKGVETLSRNGRTVVSRKVDVKSGRVSLVTHIPKALQPGRYVLKLALTATAGPRSFARTLGVRLR